MLSSLSRSISNESEGVTAVVTISLMLSPFKERRYSLIIESDIVEHFLILFMKSITMLSTMKSF